MNFNKDNEKLTKSKHGGGQYNLNKSSSRKYAIIFGVFALVAVTLSASFAFFRYIRLGDTKTTVTSGDIEFSFIEGASAGLTNAFPVADRIGAADTTGEYTFDVKLSSSSPLVTAKYVVSLLSENEGEKNFNNEHIKYNLQRNGEFIIGSNEKGELLSTIDGFNQGEQSGKGIVVFNQEIQANTTDTYKLRIWIDENVNYSNTVDGQDEQTSKGKYNGYVYSLKAKVDASVDNAYGHGVERKVTLDANGGKVEPTSITVSYDGVFGVLPTPTRNGYVFNGWYTLQEGGTPVTSETYYKEAEPEVIYAQWLVDKFNVTIDPNGGTYENSTSPSTIVLDYLDEIPLSIPERTGYNFNGWTVNGKESSVNDNVFKMGYEDTTLTAKWEKKEYKLTVNPNGGTWNDSKENQEFNIKYQDTKNIPNPTRNGYVFAGWQVSGENAEINSGIFTMGTSNAELTATWTANNYSYIVKHYQQNVDGNGYTLVDTESGYEEVSFGSQVTPNVKNYAGFTSPSKQTITISDDTSKNIVEYQYTRNRYNLTIDPNGGIYDNSTLTTSEEMYYEATKEIKNPTREGYTFTNWTVSSGSLDDKIFTISSGDATLTANWQAEGYVVTYDGNGGTPSRVNDSITYNSSYGTLATASRNGYTFAGWYTEKTGGELVTEQTIVNNPSSHTIYAHWSINTYQLNINPNFGTYDNSPSIQTFNIEYQKTKEILKPTRVGYTFDGWTLEGTGSIMSSLTDTSTFTMGYNDATLTANWKINTYKLTVKPNGGTWNSSKDNQEFTLDYLGTKEIADPVREGYTFTGWNVSGTNALLNSKIFTIGESNATLEATWEVNKYDYVTKHYQQNVTASGYTLVSADTVTNKADYGSNVTPAVKTYTGFTSPSPKTLTITTDESKNLVEYQYSRNQYSLTVKPNGGKYNNTTNDTTTKMYYQASTTIANPTRDGYTFKNWTVSGGTMADKVFTMGSSDATLTANWNINNYTLTVSPNGGTWNGGSFGQSFTMNYNSTKEIADPVREGYTFAGWSVGGTGASLNGTTFTMGSSNANLVAEWTPIKYTVTFNANGGSVTPTSASISYSSEYGTLPTPTRNGYTFNGWYTSASGGSQVTEKTILTNTSNHSIYAHWNINSYTLTVKPNSGTWNSSTSDQPYTLTYGSTKDIPVPTRTGYKFSGWTLSGKGSTMSSLTSASTFTMGYENASLTANWTINSYTLTVNPNGGTWNSTTSNSTYTLDYKGTKTIADPYRDGYTFAGWNVSGTGASIDGTTFTMGSSNVTITASWIQNYYKYITKHYQQNVTATGYTLVSADTTENTVLFGSSVMPPVNTYTGFTSPSPKTLTITSDESKNLVEYQYARNQYKLTIDPNGGTYKNTALNTIEKVYYEGSITLLTPKKTGYTFSNWVKTSGSLLDNVFTIGASDATLTANYTVNKYTVTFDANGGSVGTSSIQVTYNSTYGTLPTPTRYGYTFMGWYTSSDGGSEITSDSKFTLANDRTLYARWEALYQDGSGAAIPVVTGDLVPVKISDTGTVTKANVYQEWYDYNASEWANAVILNDEYGPYNDGVEIPEEAIESYFVWIPRYKYKIFDEGNYTALTSIESAEQEIEIEFENKTTAVSTGNSVGTWLTHPAFTSFDSNGFWVGKFESGYRGATSSTGAEKNSSDYSKLIIKPNVYSWRNITIGNAFKVSYDYQRDLDSHMMKNTEWGAVAYLSHSKYGVKDSEGNVGGSIRINNNSGRVTGYSAVDEPTKEQNGATLDGSSSVAGNRYGKASPGVDGTYTLNYLNTLSVVASSTYNYSGIYDMSGGAFEFVMGYTTGASTVGGESKITTNYSNFFTYSEWEKYYDKYTSTGEKNYNLRILGDATGEMGPFAKAETTTRPRGSWYNDYSRFISSSNPWFNRSGVIFSGTLAGIFAYHTATGSAAEDYGFRVILTPQE